MSMVTSVNYEGRLHLGYISSDNNYPVSRSLGSGIDSYYHSVAKFFTLFLGISIEVDINGKKRCLNKESFKQHLESIGLTYGLTYSQLSMNQIKKIGYHAFISKYKNNITVRSDKLGESFSIKKRTKLFEKLIAQLEVNNTEAVQKLIWKGAYIGREFFKSSNGPLDGKSFWIYRNQLESKLANHYRETFFNSYTPLAMAIEKGNQPLAHFIMHAKDADISPDKKQTFRFFKTNTATNTNNKYLYWKTESQQVEPVYIDTHSGKLII